MTREEIIKMEAGPELDSLVAEKVMGVETSIIPCVSNDGGKSACAYVSRKGPWFNEIHITDWLKEKQRNGLYLDYKIEYWKNYHPYSTDISAAWQVVEKMEESGIECEMQQFINAGACCVFIKRYSPDAGWSYADTMPLAICKAALLATLVA